MESIVMIAAASESLRFEVTTLTVRSRNRAVIADMSFIAQQGKLTWFTGENGAGKSFLLRALAGRISATGTMRVVNRRIPRTAYYAPTMAVPRNVTVQSFCDLSRSLTSNEAALLTADDPILPAVAPNALLTNISTGEAKRLLLWSVLRAPADLILLDEPYEHLSPFAKIRLTEILIRRSFLGIVMVATNQQIPATSNLQVIEIS